MAAPQKPSQLPQLPQKVTWTFLFFVYTMIFGLLLGYRYLDDLTREHAGTFGLRFLEEFTGVYSFFVLLPLMFRAAKYNFFSEMGWPRKIALHFLFGATFSLAHTTMMAVSRQILGPLLGIAHYDYGNMAFRYPMEMSNDLIAYTSVVSLYYFVQRVRMAQAEQLAAAELQTKLAEAQLENLRLQLQPHFLFNTLNTISSVMYEDVRAADAMVTQLSDLLRLTLHASRSHEIPLAEELQITRLYLELMQKRFENKLQITYAVDASLEDLLVPQLVLQPLLENSLRHGMKAGSAALALHIAALRENGSLVLKVTDTGAGIGNAKPGDVFGRGVGLSNIRDRLAHLYGDKQEFAIANRVSGGAEVTLRVPYHTAPGAAQISE
jgi:two-component system LytT family sensor kinase